ncbi:hypothetical protein BT93_I0882 [Corymbia citriodora subsp. variegata]|nr:hypothetical protein BT93_I0882 [Corymbia citriodora subsp. variegata]
MQSTNTGTNKRLIIIVFESSSLSFVNTEKQRAKAVKQLYLNKAIFLSHLLTVASPAKPHRESSMPPPLHLHTPRELHTVSSLKRQSASADRTMETRMLRVQGINRLSKKSY